MGHLLRTVNPEAADAIQPAPAERALPGIGEIVIYHMRRGHGRQGRTTFPALVQGESPHRPGTLNLTVILEAAELKQESLVDEIGPGGDEGHCWERVDNQALAGAFRNTVTALHTRIGDQEQEIGNLRNDVANLRKLILGEFDTPRVSIIDIMQDFENRLRLLKTAAAEPAERKPRAVKSAKKGKRK